MSRHPRPGARRPTRDDLAEQLGAVVIDGLCKDYGDGHGLEPTDLRIDAGQRVALVGHNGSGKTTLLRMVAGMLEPTAGRASVYGHPAGSLAARGVAAFCPDRPTFYDDLTLWQHLEFVARLHGRVDWAQPAADLLGELGLYERADDLPHRFSRGLQQKASLALTFVRPIGVVMIDEPFVGLDVAGRRVLLDLLGQAHAEEATVIVATHELAFLDHVDRVVVLADGAVTFDGAPDRQAVETILGDTH